MRFANFSFFLVLLLSFFLYLPLLIHGNYGMRDDSLLLEPLHTVHSFADYQAAFDAKKIYDLNPVRDLSYLGDLAIERATGWASFNFVNWLLWAGILFFAFRILRREFFFLFAFQPIFVGSVAWISGRKHLLAAFFCLWAMALFRRLKKSDWPWIILLYLLSVLSHPITIWFPLWAAAWLWFQAPERKREFLPLALLLGVLFTALALANSWYYAEIYPLVAGVSKYMENSFSAGTLLLAFGRAFAQIVLPLRVSSADYFPGALMNLIGLALLPFFLFFLRKKGHFSQYAPWLLLFFLPLLLLNLRPTRIFLSDTYLLFPALGIFATLELTGQQWGSKKWRIFFACLLLGFFVYSKLLVNAWSDPKKYWAFAYEVEPTPQVSYVLGMLRLQTARPEEAREIAATILDTNPNAAELYSSALLAETNLPIATRMHLLEQDWRDTIWHRYTLFALLMEARDLGKIKAAVEPLFERILEFGESAGTIGAEINAYCNLVKDPECLAKARTMQKILQQHPDEWKKFEARSLSLQHQN